MALDMFDLSPQDAIAYDDMPGNLAIAQGMGIVPVGAPHGYAKPGELDGFECATIQEFPSVVKRIFSL